MKNISYIRSVLFVALLIPWSGCSLVSESIRLSIEDAKTVQWGTRIHGDGFSVQVPETDLFLTRSHGNLSLSVIGDWPGADYNVYQFVLPAPASTLQAAWEIHVAQHTRNNFVRDYRVLSQHTNVWQGSVAWFQTGYIPSKILAANCVTRRGTNYYWIVRSIEIVSADPQEFTNTVSSAEHDLQVFLDGFQFDQQTNTALKPTPAARPVLTKP